MTDTLITASFVVGFIPAVIMLYLYGFRTRWNDSPTGRATFYLILLTAISLGISVLVRFWPEFFNSGVGEWFRIIARFSIAAVLWNFLRIFLKAQQEPADHTPSPEGKP